MYFLLGLLIFISAFPAGKFFKELGTAVSSDTLFLHENNGFVFGTVLGLLLFVKFGVLFIYIAPLLAFAIMFLSFKEKEIGVIGIVLLLVLFFISQSYWIGVFSLLLLSAILLWSKYLLPKPVASDQNDSTLPELSNKRLKVIIFIAGFNLILLQYFIVREFSTIISANELSILLVSAAYFIGFSVGYAVSSCITFTYLKVISFVTFLIHLVVFAGIKFFASYFVFKGFSLETLLLLLFVSSFLTSSFYSIFLPKIIQMKGSHKLPSFYSVELLGAVSGVIFFLLIISFAPFFLLPVYFLLLVFLYFILLDRSLWADSLFMIGIFLTGIFTIHQDAFYSKTTLDYYQSRGFPNPSLLYSNNSFYHTVDVIETFHDQMQTSKQSKISFLNGQKYFDYNYSFLGNREAETSLSEFTYFLAKLPAQLAYGKTKKNLRILILGGGSLYSISRVAPYSSKTTVVEIDPSVVESSKKWWREFNKYDQLQNYEIIIDDAKRYLKTSVERFDIIIMDISAPYYLGSALLHNKEFFELVKNKLKPDGIFSESTQGRPDPSLPNGTPMKILKAVHDVFPSYCFIDCKSAPRGKRGFIMASNNLAIPVGEVGKILREDDKLIGTALYGKEDNHFTFAGVKPYSLYSMENLWEENLKRIKTRLTYGEKRRDSALESKLNLGRSRKTDFLFPAYLRQEFLNFRFLSIGFVVLVMAFVLRYYPQKKKSGIRKDQEVGTG
jgi:spermidine synthase